MIYMNMKKNFRNKFIFRKIPSTDSDENIVSLKKGKFL